MSSLSGGDDNQQDAQMNQVQAESASKSSSQPRIRRRNRMITSCLECRRRKLKCDKLHPCTNCNKFSRECMFLAPALDSVSQQKLNEIKEKMGSLEKVLEQDVARRTSKSKDKSGRRKSADLPGEESSSEGEAGIPEDEKGLEPTPLASEDATYDVDTNDDVLDLGVRIGKMRMTERLGGLFRPRMSEELSNALQNPNSDRRSEEEKRSEVPQLPDSVNDFLEPGPTYIAPGSGFIFGDVGNRRSILDYLPTKNVANELIRNYYENVHFIARVVHWPSFNLQYDNFWTTVLAGLEPPASQQAIVMSVMFSAVASMPEAEVASIFAKPKRIVLSNFQTGTEVSLSKAQFLRATKIETLQALVIYLIPMCRDQMSRAHSVLVGTAIRLAECMGLHRDPGEGGGLSPIECHVRRTVWFQLCFLDFRTAEVQGPRPCIKREDYDTRFPLNVNDGDLFSPRVEEKDRQWTDMTVSRIRLECTEMHRIIWYDRNRLEKKKVSITHCLAKIESFRKAMEEKYSFMDTNIPIQRYARLLMDILLLRMHMMILHRYHNNFKIVIPDRLRQIILTSGTKLSESAVELERAPELSRWKWYSGAIQQWHAAFLLLTEIYMHPNRREADRIWNVVDYVFEPDVSLSRTQKARTILAAVRDRTAVYQDLRRIRVPLGMRDDMPRKLQSENSSINTSEGTTLTNQPLSTSISPIASGQTSVGQAENQPIHNAVPPASQNWGFDSPTTLFIAGAWPKEDRSASPRTSSVSQPQKQQRKSDASVFSPNSQLDFQSPSDSGSADSWPPLISTEQAGWRLAPALKNNASPPNLSYGFPTDHMPPLVDPMQQQIPVSMPSAMNMRGGTLSNMVNPSDQLMLDIDWAEWDKLFPPDINNGNLDLPTDYLGNPVLSNGG